MRIRAVLTATLVFVSSVSYAGFPSTETYLPAVGRVTGQGNPPAQFYTTVWLTNLTQAQQSFTFQFLRQGQANTSPSSFGDDLAPGETKVYENVIGDKLGLDQALGAARIVSSGDIFVSERIYNQPVGADIGETQGLFFAGVPRSFSIGPGQSASIQGVNQGGAENFRYNFALVETGGAKATVNVQVFDGSGAVLGQKTYSLLPYEQLQPNLADVVAGIHTTNARITATVTSSASELAAVGSVLLAGAQLANVSQDSSGFEATFDPGNLTGGPAWVTSLNGLMGDVTIAHGANTTVNVNGKTITIDAVSGSGAGLTAVAHDNSLTGSGTVAIPLGIAPGQVVRSLNGLHDAVTLAAGTNVTITPNGQTLTIAAGGGGGGGVASLNALTGALSITPGSGISITPSGSSIQVAYTGGGSSGLTSVTHDATLTGAGTGVSPLGIANGGVGLSQLSASGSSTGQVLTSTGSAVTWQSPSSGLTLPYTGSTSENGNAFTVTHTGNGTAIYAASNSVGVVGFGATYGLYGSGSSTSSDGVIGFTGATGPSNAAIHGVTYTNATGVLGETYGSGDTAYGVHGHSDTSGTGVFGDNQSGGYGVAGVGGIAGVAGFSSGSYGVYGHGSSSAMGVLGVATGSSAAVYGENTGTGDGVIGRADSGGYAGHFELGDVLVDHDLHVTGQIFAGTKDFEIDDPTDPENAFLIHASVESSELKNIYDGVAIVNESGLAVVELPDWFEALNGNFRYQLTPIGASQPALYVARKIEGNRFTIAGGVPGAEVSWMVTGIRRDAFAKAHPLAVRKSKTVDERGFYLHPQAFGQPEEKGIEWGRHPERARAESLKKQATAAERRSE